MDADQMIQDLLVAFSAFMIKFQEEESQGFVTLGPTIQEEGYSSCAAALTSWCVTFGEIIPISTM
jgi:hypothetical protein